MMRAVDRKPGVAGAEHVGATWFAAMRIGDFAAAWQASDRAMAMRDTAERDDPTLPYHLRWVWDGSPVDGRDVVVRCYHGLGDTLQFCRFLPELRQRAARVTLEAQPELLPLLEPMDAADLLVPFDPAAPYELPPDGLGLEIMELAHALRTAPRPVPYLPYPAIVPSRAPGPARVGACWQVRPGWRPERSMPASSIAGLAIDGVALQSLQHGMALPGMAPCPATLLETARTIAGLDIVITVDTMVAHLAGAIGKPVWLLLDTAPDWRWLAGEDGSADGSPWYAGVRKYRQRVAGDWHQPMLQVVADLTRLIRAGTVDRQSGS